jgi:hypothetical protein
MFYQRSSSWHFGLSVPFLVGAIVFIFLPLGSGNALGKSQSVMNIDPTLREHLRGLEELMTKPEIRQCPDELARLLADDFREFGASGRVFDRGQIMDALKNQPPAQLWLGEFQVDSLAPDLALVTYRGYCRFPESEKVSHSLRSSIWRNRNGRWEVVFHQGTPSCQAMEGSEPQLPRRQ